MITPFYVAQSSLIRFKRQCEGGPVEGPLSYKGPACAGVFRLSAWWNGEASSKTVIPLVLALGPGGSLRTSVEESNTCTESAT